MKNALSTFLVCMLLTTLSLAGSPASNRSTYEAGCYWMGKGKYEKAIVCFTEALKVNPKSIRARVKRGKAYLALARCKEAREDFYAALDLMEDAEFGPMRVLFSNRDTDIMSAIKNEHFDVVVGTGY